MGLNYYRHYMGDYQRDTSHLSLVQHGAYRVLLDHYYSRGCALPSDIEALQRIARAMSDDERAAVASVVSEFFPIRADGLRHNERADIEIGVGKNAIEIARENGKKGGRPITQRDTQRVPFRKPSGNTNHPPSTNQQIDVDEEFPLSSLNVARWANGAVTERWGENPNPYTERSAFDLTEQITGIAGIVVYESIFEQCRASRARERPKSVNYFGPGIRQAAERAAALAAGNASGPKHVNGNGVGKRNAQAIVTAIRALRQQALVPGQNPRPFIPRPQVEAMGADVLAAYDAMGGADVFLSTAADKLTFLVRDFDQQLRGNGT